MMEVIDEKNIVLKRELNELDLFVLKFVRTIEKYTPYVLISGYVALLFGRSRGTEDVDLFIPPLDKVKFQQIYLELKQAGFWGINADDENELYSMLKEGLAIRFAEKNKVIPNMEVKFTKDIIDYLTIEEKIFVKTKQGEIFISNIAFQVAYKRFVLKSEKDIEDALFLQRLFNITEEKINKYKHILNEHGRI
ncbi:MAG: hypothetical protein V2A62_03240 [Candidatus Woesearchaeota archaeon]